MKLKKIFFRLISCVIPGKKNRRRFRERNMNGNSERNIYMNGICHPKKNKTVSLRMIDIIVPIYNGYEYLNPLFESIYKNTELQYRLLVVNDCSTDRRIEDFLISQKEKFGESMIIINNQANLGFVKSVNKCFDIVENDFVIVNTDVELPPAWDVRLFMPIFKFKNVASVTPFSNAATIFSFPDIWVDNQLDDRMNLEEMDKIFHNINPDDYPLLAFPTGVGFCMAMSKEALLRVGKFDVIFGKGYGEENDWCQKAVLAGYINTLAPNLFVYHKHGGSFLSDDKKKLCEKNLKVIMERYPNYLSDVQISSDNKYYLKIRQCLSKYYEGLIR